MKKEAGNSLKKRDQRKHPIATFGFHEANCFKAVLVVMASVYLRKALNKIKNRP
jgi:hypothetical protein